jgi:hypothetical protein
MKNKYYFINILSLFLILLPFCPSLFAQTEEQKLTALILQKDSLFWTAYNSCDTAHFQDFFTEDVEFYHDKGGLTQGRENFTTSMKRNLCSNENFRLKREAIKGTVKVFPLRNSNVIYAAIISGDHVFYILEKGQKERLDGQAKFTHV